MSTKQTTQTETRPGRTLLVKSPNDLSTVFSSLVGLQDKSETKTTNSVFLTFDTPTNATSALKTLETQNGVTVKYSYYRVFFTMTGLTDTSDYNVVKKDLTDYVTSKTGGSVLYCKLYRKGEKYLGCGDFTLDTIASMNTLLSKETNLKNYSVNGLSGTFYRYNATKTSTNFK
jgi:hypothetical protein